MDNEEVQVQIRLVTTQEAYAVADVPYSVPSRIDTRSLNKLVNELLQDSSGGSLKPVDFEFLIHGELLRIPLHEHLTEHGISTESTVELEYIERVPAPEPQTSILHDDWVSNVRTCDRWILMGHYDNMVAVHSVKGDIVASFNEHTDRVRAVAWVSKEDASKGFITASHDLTALLWQWDGDGKNCRPCVVFRGHERGIDSLGVSPNFDRFASGGWDTNLKIWSASFDQDTDEPAHKKAKGMLTRVPLHTLKGHKETISSTVWIDPYSICTASMDHTIKFWDAELCGIKNEIVGQKAYLGASHSPLSKTVITCSADRHIRLYDPRSTEGSLCKSTFTSHSLWVSAVSWSSHNEYLFVSGSYDHSVKMWDTRSPKAPLYDISGHQDKVLCVDWSNPKYIVSGGSDNYVNVFKNKQFK